MAVLVMLDDGDVLCSSCAEECNREDDAIGILEEDTGDVCEECGAEFTDEGNIDALEDMAAWW